MLDSYIRLFKVIEGYVGEANINNCIMKARGTNTVLKYLYTLTVHYILCRHLA